MSIRIRTTSARLATLGAALALASCRDAPTAPAVAEVSTSAVKFWDVGASVAWNGTARELIALRPAVSGGGPAGQARVLAYLSIAQYNAVVAAEDANDRGTQASVAAAAAGASMVVLESFYGLLPSGLPDVAARDILNARLAAQRAAPTWPGAQQQDFAAGEEIGRRIGAEVVTYAAADRFNTTPAPANTAGGTWTPAPARPPLPAPAVILATLGSRTFALLTEDQFRPAAPPELTSAEFTSSLAEIQGYFVPGDPGRAARLAEAQLWAPRGAAYMNGIAAEMIVNYRRSEREAARVFALANMAGFDVLSACFDAKFAYYYVRPSQADPAITTLIALPNHPSYPSGHSCATSAYATVLASAFPEEADRLADMVLKAGLSRMYAGLHFDFDCAVGQALGRDVAGWVLKTAPVGHAPIPLD